MRQDNPILATLVVSPLSRSARYEELRSYLEKDRRLRYAW